MKTLIYICYVALTQSPVVQECHIEEIAVGPHNINQSVFDWCAKLRRIPSGNRLAVSQCHEYQPGEEK